MVNSGWLFRENTTMNSHCDGGYFEMVDQYFEGD